MKYSKTAGYAPYSVHAYILRKRECVYGRREPRSSLVSSWKRHFVVAGIAW